MPHLRGDGVGVLLSLRKAYKGKLTHIELMQLQGKLLGGLHFRGRNESIEQFASRTIQMSKDLAVHGIHIPPPRLKSSFISGLGPDFHEIIKGLNRNKLDVEWTPILIRDLIDPARTYLRLQQNLRAHLATYKSHTSNDTNTESSTTPSTTKNDSNNTRADKDKDRKNSHPYIHQERNLQT